MMFRNLLLLLCALACAGSLHAQSIWQDLSESAPPVSGERRIVPSKFRAVRLDLHGLRPILSNAPVLEAAVASPDYLPVLEIPMPDGQMRRFQIAETPVMAAELQAKYPDIRCYTGYGIDDPTSKIKLDLTPWGFHGMVHSARHGSFFIDPMVHGNTEYYVVYFKKDYLKQDPDQAWVCETPSPEGATELLKPHDHDHGTSGNADFQGDTRLRRYRLALACTGEYAAFHGGTKPLALAAMNTSMNRVNGVYENDFAVTMQIIANNDQIIYLNAGSDPYTNNNGGTMLGQNQTTVDNVIGTANYDIGHVFSTGGGGVAFLSSVCNSQFKARGVTGGGSPVGDPFDIDYVAHEMGHQFGGNHTFNHCGGFNDQASAMEPGSGTTIMAYAGICGADNVASNSEDFFHAYNIIEMGNFIYSGGGNTCPVITNTTNHNPTVDGGSDYFIPKSTPFALTAVGSDIDGDTLTYCWEQMDNGNAASPPTATTAVGPLFRSFKGTTSPTRVFPRLQDIVSNTNPVWEELPGVARAMKFRVVVRDNDWQAGCTDEDDVVVNVAGGSGPFLVTAPNTNIVWNVGETRTVTWDVANTTAAPVSCANVRISLSTDGGFTYPVVLLASTTNDGSADITVPNNISTTCRVKIEGVGNIFFDISNTNFRIEAPVVPTFFMNASVSSLNVCAGETGTFDLQTTQVLGFSTPAQVTITGGPAAATIAVSPNPVPQAGAGVVTISDLTSGMAGTYTLNIEAVAGAITRTTTVVLNVYPGAPANQALIAPADGALGVSSTANLTWTADFALTYEVEVATNPSFSAGSIVTAQTVTDPVLALTGLTPSTVYYWRVRSNNDCGTANFSAFAAFQTGAQNCGNVFNSTDVPKTISSSSVNSITSTLNVPAASTIEDVNLTLTVNHTWVGDLSARLISPTNDSIELFNQPGVPADDFGCGGDNINVTFDSEAALTAADLEAQCNGAAPALSGTFQSMEALSALNGQVATGTWRLIIADNYDEDGGALTAWSLSFCFPAANTAGSLLNNTVLLVPQGGSAAIASSNLQLVLSGASAQGLFVLLSLPENGQLFLSGAPLGIGGTFSQADIDAGLVTYTHSGNAETSDSFTFDAVDSNNNQWVHNSTFLINVAENNLSASLSQTQAVSCNNGSDGEITVTAAGLDGNYTYSLNGGTPQASNVFSGLAPGVYTVVVTGQFGYTVSSSELTLDNPSSVTASASVTDDDVTVTAGGGSGVYQYSINGMTFQSENTFSDLANGTYTVTVQDENGCTATTEVIIAVNTLIVNISVQSDVSCAGGNNGSVSVTAGGGQAPLSYSLNGGAPQSSNVFTGLAAGIYTVVVTDNNGLSATTPSVELTNPDPIDVAASATLNSITVTASGGTGALQYSLNGGAYQSSNVFNNLSNGVYNVTVQDANGCTESTQVTVNVAPLALSANFTPSLDCFGDADGSITAVSSGGIPPYEYKLNNGTYQSSPVFNNLAAGGYLVYVRDAAGTEVTINVTITAPAQLTVGVAVSSNDGNVSFAGGTAPYSYTTNAPNNDLQNLPNGTYSVTATDANGCTATTTFTIAVPPLVLTTTSTNVSCFGGNDGSIVLVASGGVGPYVIDGLTFQNNVTTSNLSAGSYTLIVTDDGGNESSTTVTITQPTVLVVDATVNGNNISASASGGTAPYQYSLNSGPNQDNGTFANLAAGSYTVVVTDANGCTVSINNLTVTSGVIEPGSAWGLTVSPNPGSGLFTLTMQQAPAVLKADVYDAAGRLIRSLDFAPVGGQFITQIDLRDVANGTYLLRLSDGKQWGGVRLSKVD